MATITLSATGLVPKTWTLTDAETTRVIAAYQAIYGQINTGTPEAPVMRDMTTAETFDALAGGVFNGIRDNVLNHEKVVAAAAPVAAVVPIVVA